MADIIDIPTRCAVWLGDVIGDIEVFYTQLTEFRVRQLSVGGNHSIN